MSGIKMTADIETKPLASERLKQLKQEMHMMVDVPQSEVQKEPQKEEEKEAKKMIHSGSNEEVQKAASVEATDHGCSFVRCSRRKGRRR
jgi:predicted HicB family RNase H-like nuclease